MSRPGIILTLEQWTADPHWWQAVSKTLRRSILFARSDGTIGSLMPWSQYYSIDELEEMDGERPPPKPPWSALERDLLLSSARRFLSAHPVGSTLWESGELAELRACVEACEP